MTRELENELDKIELEIGEKYERLSNCRELLDQMAEILNRYFWNTAIGDDPKSNKMALSEICGCLRQYNLMKDKLY